MHRTAWFVSFLLAAPITLISALLFFLTLSPKIVSPVRAPQVLSAYAPIFEPQTLSAEQLQAEVIPQDARALLVKKYLDRYQSELSGFSDLIVDISDRYQLDFRLLVAIAQQESNLCKKIPADSFNCWGFGIYGDKVTRFSSYEEGLETVAKTLRREYLDKGLLTPEQIMTKYTPPSVALGGPWARGVNQFMSEME